MPLRNLYLAVSDYLQQKHIFPILEGPNDRRAWRRPFFDLCHSAKLLMRAAKVKVSCSPSPTYERGLKVSRSGTKVGILRLRTRSSIESNEVIKL